MSMKVRGILAVLATLTLTACASAPEVAPEEEFLLALEAKNEGLNPNTDRDEIVETGQWVCDTLDVDHVLMDGAVAAWNVWRNDMGDFDADVFWSTAVDHLCPAMAENYQQTRETAEAIGPVDTDPVLIPGLTAEETEKLHDLARDCVDGDMGRCNILHDLARFQAPGSDYERTGATCGGRNEPLAGEEYCEVP